MVNCEGVVHVYGVDDREYDPIRTLWAQAIC